MNAQLEMEKCIEQARSSGKKPSVVLHCCCAPCSSAVLERLAGECRLLLYYYNPNIEPREEYDLRFRELETLLRRMPGLEQVRAVCGPYENEKFHDAVRGLETLGERSERCAACFHLRLERTASFARQECADWFATTLTLSPLKDSNRINRIGVETAEKEHIAYLPSDFKKKNGYKRSCELSKEYGLYRQDYCGCIYSKLERERRAAGLSLRP